MPPDIDYVGNKCPLLFNYLRKGKSFSKQCPMLNKIANVGGGPMPKHITNVGTSAHDSHYCLMKNSLTKVGDQCSKQKCYKHITNVGTNAHNSHYCPVNNNLTKVGDQCPKQNVYKHITNVGTNAYDSHYCPMKNNGTNVGDQCPKQNVYNRND